MTHCRLALVAATIFVTAGVFVPAASARVEPGTEPDLPELNRSQNVDRRVSIDVENVPAFKVLHAIVAGQAGLRYKVVGADSLRGMRASTERSSFRR